VPVATPLLQNIPALNSKSPDISAGNSVKRHFVLFVLDVVRAIAPLWTFPPYQGSFSVSKQKFQKKNARGENKKGDFL
jgi:hypothetical protein